MNERIRISAKNLGAVALPDFCPRCFWIKIKLQHRLPYQIFPGIFSAIDAYTKNVIHGWFDRHGASPPWLADLGNLAGYRLPPHYNQFQIVDETYDVLLTGSPDGVFVRPDGSYVIVDYKTARHTATQDQLYPMYEVQLNAYARIGAQCGLAPVSALALLYTEPTTDKVVVLSHGIHRDDGFVLGFAAKVVPVPLDGSILTPLLAQTREIHDRPTSPPRRDGCQDCARLDALMAIAEM